MVNDVSIIVGIISAFVLIGIALPFVNEAFGVSPEETACFKIDTFEEELGNATVQVVDKSPWWEDLTDALNPLPKGSTSIFDVFWSVVKMFFWTCGALPAWLDAIFLIFRITLILIVARNLWIGGGS